MSTKKIATPLSRKAVLVSVNISQWTARKLDKKVTDETNRRHNATADAGRYNKLLIAADHLKELSGLVSKARQLHYQMTRPWADEGPRILANVLYSKFTDEFRSIKREFSVAADRFAKVYPSLIEERKGKLNGMFNEADYPPPSQIRSKFSLDLTVLPFPDADDFRSTLDDETVEEIRQQLKSTSDAVLNNAMKTTAEQIIETVGTMARKLAEYKASGGKGDKAEGVFRDSLVENVRELAELLPAFNLTDDPKLDAITKRIKSELCVEEAKDLRANEAVRETVQKSADDIVAAVSQLFG
jgi:hypothetical protein